MHCNFYKKVGVRLYFYLIILTANFIQAKYLVSKYSIKLSVDDCSAKFVGTHIILSIIHSEKYILLGSPVHTSIQTHTQALHHIPIPKCA